MRCNGNPPPLLPRMIYPFFIYNLGRDRRKGAISSAIPQYTGKLKPFSNFRGAAGFTAPFGGTIGAAASDLPGRSTDQAYS
jgi:hypothetical protein